METSDEEELTSITETTLRGMVCPWGGESEGTCLQNTCTVDNALSRLFIHFKKNQTFANLIKVHHKSDDVCNVLHHMFQILHDGKSSENWTRARKIWLARLAHLEVNRDVSTLHAYILFYFIKQQL